MELGLLGEMAYTEVEQKMCKIRMEYLMTENKEVELSKKLGSQLKRGLPALFKDEII